MSYACVRSKNLVLLISSSRILLRSLCDVGLTCLPDVSERELVASKLTGCLIAFIFAKTLGSATVVYAF